MDVQSDEELVAESLDGNCEAYARLIHRHSRHVFAVCLGISGTFEDAEDLAQETFVRGFSQLNRLQDRGQFRAWVAKIARNLSLDHLRRRKHEKDLPKKKEPEVSDDYSDLHDAIARLPEKYRLPLMLYYFDGRSSESVAEALSISPAGVLTRLSRARKELRRLLSSKEAGHEGKLRKHT